MLCEGQVGMLSSSAGLVNRVDDNDERAERGLAAGA
jgi:hypothetical protein